jgi:hypothetical protein
MTTAVRVGFQCRGIGCGGLHSGYQRVHGLLRFTNLIAAPALTVVKHVVGTRRRVVQFAAFA